MSIAQMMRERWLTILGVFLITAGIDAFINSQAVISNLPAQLGQAFQFYHQEPQTQNLPPYIVKLYDFPLLVPAIIGIVLVGLDYFRKRKKTSIVQVS